MSTSITVTDIIFSGHLGDGWLDNFKTGEVFAEILKINYIEITQRHYPKAKVEVDIKVVHGDGFGPKLTISVDEDGIEDKFQYHPALEEHLLSERNEAWTHFAEDSRGDIFTDIEALEVRGESITRTSIRHELGDTGSYSAISAILKTWRENKPNGASPLEPLDPLR